MNLFLKKIGVLAFVFIAGIKTFAQVANYPFNQSSGTYNAISGGTVFGSTTSDDEYFVDATVPLGGFVTTGIGMPIGFNFVFNGNVYDRFGISNNGWISLGQSTLTPNQIDMNTNSSFSPISATSTASLILQNKIVGLARDLQGQTGSELRAQTIGTAPNQTLVVQFKNYRKFGGTGDSFDFQICLLETSNKIEVIYGTYTTTSAASAQVGLKGTVITDFNNRDVSTSNTWATSIAGVANTAVVNFNSTLTPVSGQKYQWSPPANCSGTPNSGTASISSSTGCPNATFSLTANGLSVASGLTFQWQSAPASSGPWTNIIGANTINYTTTANALTFYQLVTTCTISSQSATTSIVSYSIVNPGPCVCNGYGQSAATSTFDEEIYNVTFGTLNNPSTCTTVAPGIGSAQNLYSNYSGFVTPPTVLQGQSVPFGVTLGTCNGWYGMSLNIYIDYNQNGLFTDPGELTYSTTTAIQGNNTGNILVPPTASVGTTRMRVVAVEGTVPGPTGTYAWGETEDYCITIITPSPCAGTPNSGFASVSSPTGCVNDVITLNSSSITVAGGITYQWQSAPSASGPWTNMPGGTTVNFTATAANTTFYQMVTTCSTSAQSATTSIVSYTPSNCYLMNNSTITACGGTIYDSGGPNNNYQSNEDYTLTILPATPSASVMLTFQTFSTEATYDFLYIYDGNSTAAPLIGSYDGNTLPPVITATNSSGILTLEFTSDGSVEYTGFSAAISCFTPCAGPPAAPTATASSVCAGGQATLTASVIGTPKWYATPTSTNYIAVGNPFITPTLTSNITYYVKDSSSCGISSVTAITISVSPAQTLTAVASNTNICLGNSATLTASGVSTYTWSNSSTQSVIVVTPTTTTTYSVIGHSNLCNTNQTAILSLSVNPTPTVSLVAGASTICAGAGSISLSGSPNGGTYSGAAVNGTLLSIANAGTFTPMYSYTNSVTGCSNTATTTVVVVNCTGINNSSYNSDLVTIYPNPTNGTFVLSTSNTTSKTIEITDVAGKIIYNQTSVDEKIQINMSEKSNGVYYLKLISDKTTLVFKVIKQ